MRGWSCGGQKLMQTRESFCEVFTPKFSFFPLTTKLFVVICRWCNTICPSTKLLLPFAYLRA